eukprot:172975-Hanusia_phi.AAC.1
MIVQDEDEDDNDEDFDLLAVRFTLLIPLCGGESLCRSYFLLRRTTDRLRMQSSASGHRIMFADSIELAEFKYCDIPRTSGEKQQK